MTKIDFEAGVKGKIQHLLKFAGHDILLVSFTAAIVKEIDIRPFLYDEARVKGQILHFYRKNSQVVISYKVFFIPDP